MISVERPPEPKSQADDKRDSETERYVMNQFLLTNSRTGGVVATRARLADNPWLRVVGLLGKKGLPPGEGLLIRPCWSIHTAFMRFALDVVFLSREGDVIKVAPRLPAFRMAAARGAHEVLEMAAGALDGVDLQPGDHLLATPVQAAAVAAAP